MGGRGSDFKRTEEPKTGGVWKNKKKKTRGMNNMLKKRKGKK